MQLKVNPYYFTIVFIVLVSFGKSQNFNLSNGSVTGNFQIDVQYYRTDSVINAIAPEDKIRMNAFGNILYTNGNFTAGARYEAYHNALLGFLPGYKGTGIPYRFIQYRNQLVDITVGSFYEQFGSGLVLRAYEERLLGYDNAFDGARVKINAGKGFYFKGLIGKQRLFFQNGPGIVRGFDGEWNLNEFFSKFAESKHKITLGGSFASRYQDPTGTQFVLPANVGCWGYRANYNYIGKKYTHSFQSEYVYKINDPNRDNGYIYKNGIVLMGVYNFSVKNRMGLMLSTKYHDNMAFRSDRDQVSQNLLINFIPALCRPHTYNLAATLYPYATQPNGEFAAQGELSFKVKPGEFLGGKNGMQITINYSHINDIDSLKLNDESGARQGYTARLFSYAPDRTYLRDLNIEVKKKFNDNWRANFMYMYLEYDINVSQGKIGAPLIYADIVVADITYKLKTIKKQALRFELQHLNTKQDQGNWATALVEYTYQSHWFFAALNQYNYGNPDEAKRAMYPYLTVGYIQEATRITIGAGRQRAGLFCVGGVCRPVPAANGVTFTISHSF